MKVVLTTLAGDTPWNAKLLRVAGATGTNACHECYVPTIQVQDGRNDQKKQKYTAYRRGFELTQPMIDTINKTKSKVSLSAYTLFFFPCSMSKVAEVCLCSARDLFRLNNRNGAIVVIIDVCVGIVSSK